MPLLALLVDTLEVLATEHRARRVVRVRVCLGALSMVSADQFRAHFEHAIRGTVADGAFLEIVTCTDQEDPDAQNFVLDSVDLE